MEVVGVNPRHSLDQRLELGLDFLLESRGGDDHSLHGRVVDWGRQLGDGLLAVEAGQEAPWAENSAG